MSNMSYCRWENTLADLQDCAEHVMDTGLSPTEEEARRRLLKTCVALGEYAYELDEEEEG
jgi:hypothetical protein